jgi:hypothetical protein
VLVSGRLREIARQTVAIAEAGRYRNAGGDEVDIGEAVRAPMSWKQTRRGHRRRRTSPQGLITMLGIAGMGVDHRRTAQRTGHRLTPAPAMR